MKIAIKGHLTRGKKIIQILESLGGINTYNYVGNNVGSYYELHGNSIVCMSTKSDNIKYYTLEEFEKEFPFKFGDKVIALSDNKPYKIIALEHYNGKLCYKLDNGFHYQPRVLKSYKEMKEERSITLTLEKAKEWYKKGGELKEIALQAFTERELNPLPRSWEEYTDKMALIRVPANRLSLSSLPEKYIALYKLEQLRNCWWSDWRTEWNNCEKYVIKWDNDDLIIFTARNIRAFLVFPTREMTYEFLKCFRDLIEKAGDLI